MGSRCFQVDLKAQVLNLPLHHRNWSLQVALDSFAFLYVLFKRLDARISLIQGCRFLINLALQFGNLPVNLILVALHELLLLFSLVSDDLEPLLFILRLAELLIDSVELGHDARLVDSGGLQRCIESVNGKHFLLKQLFHTLTLRTLVSQLFSRKSAQKVLRHIARTVNTTSNYFFCQIFVKSVIE